MRLPGDLGHLTYCTNVHRGETWDEVWHVLRHDVLAVKREICPHAPFGVGLRLSGKALAAARRPETAAMLKDFLAANGLYVFTLNAFPYGPFHGVPVKADVYLPDWRDETRLAYTNEAAELLAFLLPDELRHGSVSSVPGAFKPCVAGPADVARMADLMIRHAAHLVEIERRTGHRIQLALEPEPCCFLETTAEAVDFFETWLLSAAAAARLAGLTGSSRSQAEDALRHHLGVCVDLCHAAVEFETVRDVFGALRGAGIALPKVQISAALRLTPVDARAADALRPFDDGIYLHQVVAQGRDGLHRHADLADAIATLGRVEASEWRVHYHVPLFLDRLGVFASTQDFAREALAMHRLAPLSAHLEVETYTWDVLPDRYRAGAVPSIARELRWVHDQLIS